MKIEKLAARLSLLATFILLLGQERMVLHVGGEGRGNLSLMVVVYPLIIMISLLVSNNGRAVGLIFDNKFWKIWAPYIAISVLLPILGVISDVFPLRSVLTSWVSAMPLFLMLAGVIWASDCSSRLWMENLLLFAIVIQALFAVVQLSSILGVENFGVIRSILEWDKSFKLQFSERNIILGRATGSFLNPNAFGVWGCLAFWSSGTLLNGWKRASGKTISIITVLLSNSRGSLAALVFSVICRWVISRRNKHKIHMVKLWQIYFVAVCVFVVCIYLNHALISGMTSMFGVDILQNMTARISSGINVVTAGVEADRNLFGRVNVWKEGWRFYQENVFGTFGSPQMIFKHPIDNDFMHVLLQGGVLYLSVYLNALVRGVMLLSENKNISIFVGASSAAVLMNAISATPFLYPSMGLFWFFVGAYFGDKEIFVKQPGVIIGK